MKDYEGIVVFKPDLEEEEFEQHFKKVEKVVKKQGGKITDVQKWGLRDLAYEIQKYKQGNYVLLNFQCDPKGIAAIERHYKLADPIIRFITLNTSPYQPKATDQSDLSPQKEE